MTWGICSIKSRSVHGRPRTSYVRVCAGWGAAGVCWGASRTLDESNQSSCPATDLAQGVCNALCGTSNRGTSGRGHLGEALLSLGCVLGSAALSLGGRLLGRLGGLCCGARLESAGGHPQGSGLAEDRARKGLRRHVGCVSEEEGSQTGGSVDWV